MAFGFVIAKFDLFLRVISGRHNAIFASGHASDWLGIAFAAFGCVLAVVGVWRVLVGTAQLERGRFRSSIGTIVLIGSATAMLGIGVVLSLLRLL